MIQPNRISSFGFVLSSSGLGEADHAKLKTLGSELEDFYTLSLDKARAIDDDDTYTSAGKLKMKRKLTEELREALVKYDRLAHGEMSFTDGKSWALEARELRETMQAGTRPKLDPVLAELRNQERRAYLLSMDPTRRSAEIQAAASRDDFSLLDAATSGPQPSQTYLLDKTKAELEAKRIEALNPAAARRLREVERAQRVLTGMVSSLKHALRKAELFEEQPQDIQFLNQAS